MSVGPRRGACLFLLGAACLAGEEDEAGFESEGERASAEDAAADCGGGLPSWSAEWIALEEEVVVLMNARRAEGARCGGEGAFAPAAPLATDHALRCAARAHARDMGENDYFDHVSPDGATLEDRLDTWGYAPERAAGEDIAGGYATAQDVVLGWMRSDGHCAIIMEPLFEDVGVGTYEAPEHELQVLWTADFGG